MKTVILELSKWAHSLQPEEHGFTTSLRVEDGSMCCLGFLGRACGIDEEEMTDVSTPSCDDAEWDPEHWPEGLFEYVEGQTFVVGSSSGGRRVTAYTDERQGSRFQFEDILVALNDMANVDVATKLEWLKEGFKQIGCELVVKD